MFLIHLLGERNLNAHADNEFVQFLCATASDDNCIHALNRSKHNKYFLFHIATVGKGI